MPDKELPKLQKALAELSDELLSKEDFVRSFENVINLVIKIEKRTTDTVTAIEQTVTNIRETAKNDRAAAITNLTALVNAAIARLDDKLATLKDGKDGVDGAPGPQGPQGEKGDPADLRDLAAYGAATRDGLELLQGDDRLDKSAVKGIDKLEASINQLELRPTGRGGGSRGIGLYIGGSKKLFTAQTLNLIAGTGITLSYARANGRNDITITATGTASLSPIAVTGTIDDSNTSFTAASAPNLIIVNGASYRNGHGCTIVGTAITLDNPVGSGGDIYCL